MVRNKAIYLALGIRPDGSKEPLGLWIEQTEGAKFWLRAMNDLKARGVNDILIATVDGLKGFPLPKTRFERGDDGVQRPWARQLSGPTARWSG